MQTPNTMIFREKGRREMYETKGWEWEDRTPTPPPSREEKALKGQDQERGRYEGIAPNGLL
jgi:hypothetical protein